VAVVRMSVVAIISVNTGSMKRSWECHWLWCWLCGCLGNDGCRCLSGFIRLGFFGLSWLSGRYVWNQSFNGQRSENTSYRDQPAQTAAYSWTEKAKSNGSER